MYILHFFCYHPLESTYQIYHFLRAVLGYTMALSSKWSPDGAGRIHFGLDSAGELRSFEKVTDYMN
jgi:hypothetical protein